MPPCDPGWGGGVRAGVGGVSAGRAAQARGATQLGQRSLALSEGAPPACGGGDPAAGTPACAASPGCGTGAHSPPRMGPLARARSAAAAMKDSGGIILSAHSS